jgi:hypothetical protein
MLPLFVLTILAGVILAGIPALLVFGICSTFLSGAWPWIVGGLFGLPIFLLVAFSPEFLVEGLAQIFRSSVWTLAYRELKALETLTPTEATVEEA